MFVYIKVPMKLAVGTSMASFVWIALVRAIFKLVERTVNIPVAITLGIGALIGAIVGAKLIVKFKPDYIETVIRSDVLVCIAEIYFYIFWYCNLNNRISFVNESGK